VALSLIKTKISKQPGYPSLQTETNINFQNYSLADSGPAPQGLN